MRDLNFVLYFQSYVALFSNIYQQNVGKLKKPLMF